MNPEIYDEIIKEPDHNIHPKNWSEEKKQEIIEYWKHKLEPPLRLPQGWENYLRDPSKLLLEPKEIEFEERYNQKDYIEMNCKDDSGITFPQTLEEKIYNWLGESNLNSRAVFLLGEFGDGKTFFTYIFSKKLAENFLHSPKDGWLPIRFALKNYPKEFDPESSKNIRDFLQHRLTDFGADIAGWNELRNKKYKLLAILDGFDELSKELDPETIQKNIKILQAIYYNDYFSDMKIIIISRKHFFENYEEKELLISNLDKPQLLHLAPIDRKTTEDYLRKYAQEIGEEEKFNRLKECHDPIGLASKPLFLEMVRVSLADLPEEKLNEYSLYESYIEKALDRKYNYLINKNTAKEKIIENLHSALELIAIRLHKYDKEFVYLSEIKGEQNLKKWIWDELSDPAKNIVKDETGRIATRSLLKRINVKSLDKDKMWPIDFCHRSMREYFVARAICKLIESKQEDAKEFLMMRPLEHEILFFAKEIMKNSRKEFDYKSRLLNLILETKDVEDIEKISFRHLGGNAVNLLYQYEGHLPGCDWHNLVLDGAELPYADLSGKDFSYTFLQYAKLDNVIFTNSNFSKCNLTGARIEEAAPVQSIAITSNENILALYYDGVIREWSYQRPHRAIPTNLSGHITGKDMKIIALPGNNLTLFNDRYISYYDRNKKKLKLKAIIETNPNFRLVKATRDYLLINEEKNQQNHIHLIELNKEAAVKSIICPPFIICDHLDHHALIVFNDNEELQLIDIASGGRNQLDIPTKEKIACLATYKCKGMEIQYLLGLGLYNGTVEVWEIHMQQQWEFKRLLTHLVHEQGQPIKDITFSDEYKLVSGGLDRSIKLLTFDHEGQVVGNPLEYKMAPQFMGMKIDGVSPEVVRKQLQNLIDKAMQRGNSSREKNEDC